MTSTVPDPDPVITQQAAATSGASFWSTKQLDSAAAFALHDGPHGLRKQTGTTDHLGIGESVPATCFPPAVGLAQTWSVALAREVGAALGRECRAENVGVLLGPGVNIKRDPRGGRNFEYLSEDPHLTGALGAAWVTGLQEQGAGASVKHFAANNAENDRMRSSSDIDPRTLREIYLRGFERIVRDARPWTIMCSYNRLNGVRVSEDRWLLTDVLRGEWGFTGAVVSDWGAVRNRPAALAAGVDLAMPGPDPRGDERIVAAVAAGELPAATVARAAGRLGELSARIATQPGVPVDRDAHHALAARIAAHAIVLLRNENALLPLDPGRSVAVIGEFARTPRYQGGGSSHVNPTRLDIPLDEIRRLAATEVPFATGFTTDGGGDAAALRREAVDLAAAASVAVLFLGVAAGQESEGFDRDHIELPADQLTLLREIAAVQPDTVVVLSHGGVLRLAPVARLAPAILDGALLGQAGGTAIAEVLYGVVNPSGKVAETVPARLEDVPSYLEFPGEFSHTRYAEGLFVGYRWYDARAIEVTFPFGHGLSYTSFEYSDLRLTTTGAGLTATVAVTNTGSRTGREVVQFYAGLPGSAITRAVRELKGFAEITLEPGETADVAVLLRREDLCYWDIRTESWLLESGDYEIVAAASSADLRLRGTVTVIGDTVPLSIGEDTTLGEVLADPAAAAMVVPLLQQMMPAGGEQTALGMDLARMMLSIPLGMLASFAGGDGPDLVEQIAKAVGTPD
ncbi:glycoside hydrolase family 3 C-terminal domain-containing protein [Nocardia sp. alder85J]|uniref:glycoside hydrolase family 3 C-terminal domain-containing protein n=1 Tax=Nocardia sp. alder85J TaxID=2862949 RepID=UPI001CD7195E|nr:glycoside hydrolase family 3 C-terminal domain-containing protein [Nocardia sp. alder85J]MCX4098496.1 glycoside hydrolase family 3 C-terminal domain-containing protein [Nocardia sp. alder85J]